MIPNYFPSDPRDYLREELNLRQHRRPQYSLRAFARDLNMSPSSLCEFLAGRQGLSQERVRHVGAKLGLVAEQQEHFWDLIESRFGRSEEDRHAARIRAQNRAVGSQQHLSLERFRLVADWYHLTLLEILSLPRRYTHRELANILNIDEAELTAALNRLRQLDLLQVEETESGLRYSVTSEVTSVGEEIPDEAIRLCHQQTLMMHAQAVEKKSMDERESLAIAFKIAQRDWPEIRREMKKAIVSVASRYGLEAEANDQVLSLSMQMITLLPDRQEKSGKEQSGKKQDHENN